MDQKAPEKNTPAPNLLMELAKRKTEAQKAGSHFSQFGKNKARANEKSKPFVPRGGRNGQGKPC